MLHAEHPQPEPHLPAHRIPRLRHDQLDLRAQPRTILLRAHCAIERPITLVAHIDQTEDEEHHHNEKHNDRDLEYRPHRHQGLYLTITQTLQALLGGHVVVHDVPFVRRMALFTAAPR